MLSVPPLPPYFFEMLDATKKRLGMSLDAISHERAQNDYMDPPAHGRSSRISCVHCALPMEFAVVTQVTGLNAEWCMTIL